MNSWPVVNGEDQCISPVRRSRPLQAHLRWWLPGESSNPGIAIYNSFSTQLALSNHPRHLMIPLQDKSSGISARSRPLRISAKPRPPRTSAKPRSTSICAKTHSVSSFNIFSSGSCMHPNRRLSFATSKKCFELRASRADFSCVCASLRLKRYNLRIVDCILSK